jgi:hypothetical protein
MILADTPLLIMPFSISFRWHWHYYIDAITIILLTLRHYWLAPLISLAINSHLFHITPLILLLHYMTPLRHYWYWYHSLIDIIDILDIIITLLLLIIIIIILIIAIFDYCWLINTTFIDYAIDITLRHITLAIDILHIAILISHYILLLITPLLLRHYCHYCHYASHYCH